MQRVTDIGSIASIHSADAAAGTSSCLDACRQSSPGERERLENRELVDQRDLRLPDRPGGPRGNEDELAEGSCRDLSGEDGGPSIAGRSSTRPLGPRRGREGSDEGEAILDCFNDSLRCSDLEDALVATEAEERALRQDFSSKALLEVHAEMAGWRWVLQQQYQRERMSSPKDISAKNRESGTRIDEGRLTDLGHLVSIGDLINLKLLVANQQAAIDALQLANRQLTTAVTRFEMENRYCETREHADREQGLWKSVEVERRRQLARRNDALARENAELRARLARLAPARKAGEVDFDARMTRRDSCLVGGAHGACALLTTCSTAESLNDIGACALGEDAVDEECAAKASGGSASWPRESS